MRTGKYLKIRGPSEVSSEVHFQNWGQKRRNGTAAEEFTRSIIEV